MNISIIVAISKNGVIGRNNKLAWNLPDDMFYFSKMTMGHSVIMGRKNWDSIPNKWRPLPNRKNIIISRNINQNIKNVDITNSIEKAIKIGRKNKDEEIFIIGGGEIYKLGFKFVDKLDSLIVYYNDLFNTSFNLFTNSAGFSGFNPSTINAWS